MLSSAGSGPGYDTVFSVVLMRTLQRSDAGCKSPTPSLHALFLSGPYLDVRSDRIVCDGSVLRTTHVSMGGVVVFLSVVITVFVRWFSLPLLLSIFPPPIHKCSTFSLVYFLWCYTATLSLGVNSALSQRWCKSLIPFCLDPCLSPSAEGQI